MKRYIEIRPTEEKDLRKRKTYGRERPTEEKGLRKRKIANSNVREKERERGLCV